MKLFGLGKAGGPGAGRLAGGQGDEDSLQLGAPARELPNAFVLESPVPVWTRTFAITSWPRGAGALWESLLASQVAFRVRFLAAPSGFKWGRGMETRLRRLMANVESVRESDRAAAARPEEVLAIQAIRRIRDALLYRGLRPVDIWCLITVESDSPANLAADCAAVTAALASRGIEAEPLTFDQSPAWAATLPTGDPQLRGIHGLKPRTGIVTAAARAVPADTGMGGDGCGVYVGHDAEGRRPVMLDFRRESDELNSNALVFGASGEGKSTWLKAVAVTGMLLDGWRVIVLDVDGEYRGVCEAAGGTWVDLSGVTGRYPDPCRFADPSGDPEEDAARFDRLLAGIDDVMSVMLGIEGPELELERAVVEQEAAALLASSGVTRDDPATWSNDRLPRDFTLRAVFDRIERRGAAGDTWARAAAQRLWRYFKGSLAGLFERPLPMDRMPGRLVVLYLGNPRASSAEEAAIGVKYQLAVRAVWEWLRQNKARGEWTAVVVDEAQRAMQHPVLAANVVDVATTIRKWRGSLFLATNAPADLWGSGWGERLWGNSLYKVIFALERDQVDALARRVNLPPGVAQAIASQTGMKRAVIRDGGRGWIQVRLSLPDEELELYRTRRVHPGVPTEELARAEGDARGLRAGG
ncbi:MAG: hypothetical protein QJR08_00310 [Bacillota bacterium]|nr:hypothetical protein [Bacillota bacterium]